MTRSKKITNRKKRGSFSFLKSRDTVATIILAPFRRAFAYQRPARTRILRNALRERGMVGPSPQGKEEFHAPRAHRHLEETRGDHQERFAGCPRERRDIRRRRLQGPIRPFLCTTNFEQSKGKQEDTTMKERLIKVGSWRCLKRSFCSNSIKTRIGQPLLPGGIYLYIRENYMPRLIIPCLLLPRLPRPE